MVDYSASGPDIAAVIRLDGVRQLFPVHQIGTDRVTPCYVTPFDAPGVMLKEEMILALVVNQPVWIIHPVFFRRKMKLRPILFVV
jgi:hypothetical protein